VWWQTAADEAGSEVSTGCRGSVLLLLLELHLLELHLLDLLQLLLLLLSGCQNGQLYLRRIRGQRRDPARRHLDTGDTRLHQNSSGGRWTG
jgi:hypothetical protein